MNSKWAYDMEAATVKKIIFLLLFGSLLVVAACASPEPWWQGKPISQMTPAERQEQDPMFWPMYGHWHGLGE
jgi:hypothetical protein